MSDTSKYIYIYRFNPIESNYRDGPAAHKNYYLIFLVGMGDYENMSQRLLFLQVSRLLRLLATLHMYVDFIQQSN